MENLQPILTKSKNEVKIIGLIKSHDLKLVVYDGKQQISGNMIIQTTTDKGIGEHKVKLSQKMLTNSGNENKLYKSLVTIMNDYKTIEKHGVENADLVSIVGEYNENIFFDDNTKEAVEYKQIKGTFVNRLDKTKLMDAQGATFDFSCIIKNSELVQPDKAKVTVLITKYDGTIFPMDCVVNGELAPQFTATYTPGDKAELFSNIVVVAETKEVIDQSQVAFGQAPSKVVTSVTKEIEIYSGYNPEKSTPEFDEVVKNAITARELLKQQRIDEGIAKNTAPKGFGTTQQSPFGNNNVETPFGTQSIETPFGTAPFGN